MSDRPSARTILVLSATGTTGSATLAALAPAALAGEVVVRAASRDPGAAKLPAGVQAVRFDLDDRATWGPSLAGVDALYLALPPFRADEVPVATALLDAARQAEVRRVVKLSAMGVDQDPQSGHRQVELCIEATFPEWIHLRPTFFMENFLTFYGHGIRHDGGIFLPAGAGRTGFVAADDIGRVAARALRGDDSGQAWELTGPQALDHAEVAAIIARASGRPVAYVDVSPEDHVAGMRAFGMPEVGVATMSALYGMVRAGWTAGLSDRVSQVLGRPPVAFADWAQERAAAWQA